MDTNKTLIYAVNKRQNKGQNKGDIQTESEGLENDISHKWRPK